MANPRARQALPAAAAPHPPSTPPLPPSANADPAAEPPGVRLVDQVRAVCRRRHFSYRTEQTYLGWIRSYIRFHDRRHPRELGAEEIRAFLTHLATRRRVAPSTQNQALSALLFLYRQVLAIELPWLGKYDRTMRPRKLPVVLTRAGVQALLVQLEGTLWLMASLMYGSGMRLMECLCLRVKDIDFTYRQIQIRSAKGGKDRTTVLPDTLLEPLQRHLANVKTLHQRDLALDYRTTDLPYALERKYPHAAREWGWQFAFPSQARSADRRRPCAARSTDPPPR